MRLELVAVVGSSKSSEDRDARLKADDTEGGNEDRLLRGVVVCLGSAGMPRNVSGTPAAEPRGVLEEAIDKVSSKAGSMSKGTVRPLKLSIELSSGLRAMFERRRCG